MAKKTNVSKEIDAVDIAGEVGNLTRSISTMFVKEINSKRNRDIERTVNNDPRTKIKRINPKKDIREDLNLC